MSMRRTRGKKISHNGCKPTLDKIGGGRMPSGGLKLFGWGREGGGLTAEEEAFLIGRYRDRFAVEDFDAVQPPQLADIKLRSPRITPPAALGPICTTDHYERAVHTYGKSFA